MAVYDRDPAHLWNRLHETLFVRVGPDGVRYGEDRPDPLLWDNTRYLLEGKGHRQALSLLDEFLSVKGEQLAHDALQRAYLQHDLWVLFDWTVDGSPGDEYARQREALRQRLAPIIRRLALSAAEIATLPDNYAAARRSGLLGGLPPALMSTDGDWVLVSRADGKPVAPVHMMDFGGRSTFEVRLSLPGGQDATRIYLNDFRDAAARVVKPITPPSAAQRDGIYSVPSAVPVLFATEALPVALIEGDDGREFTLTVSWKRNQVNFKQLQRLWSRATP